MHSFDAAWAEKFAEGGQEGSKEEKNNLHVGECRAGADEPQGDGRSIALPN